MSAESPVSIIASAAATVIAADTYRSEVTLKLTGNDAFLGFNETAVDETGIPLVADTYYVITGGRARSEISAICASGNTATIYVDGFGIV